MVKIYVDGSGWNGKEAKYCVFIEGKIPKIFIYKTKRTNNEMEYYALIYALEIAEEGDTILSDSALVVNQVKGFWKCNFEHLRKLRETAKLLLKGKNINIVWIRREVNKAGKILEGKI